MIPSFLGVTVVGQSNPSLQGTVLSSCLDTPLDNQVSSESFKVSGWVLKKSAEQAAYLICRSAERDQLIELSLPRQDVVKSVLKVADSECSSHPLILCGFSAQVAFSEAGRFSLIAVIDGVETLWKKIELIKTNSKFERFLPLWQKHVSKGAAVAADEFPFETLKRVDRSFLESIVFGALEVDDFEKLRVSGVPETLRQAKLFLDYVRSDDFVRNAVGSALQANCVMVPDPFGYGYARSLDSFTFKCDVNVLRFRSATGELFFIFQHVSSCDAIYFPARKRLVKICHLSDGVVKDIMLSYIVQLPEMTSLDSVAKKFLGVVASHSRPYHFYYDVAPAMGDLNTAGLLSGIPNIFYYKGGDFCSFKALYPTSAVEHVLAAEDICSFVRKQRGFVFHVGTVFQQFRKPNVDRFDTILNAHARKTHLHKDDSALQKLSACYPVVWFGVTSQKRSWSEQVEATASIVNKLREDYPNIGVVFDGWTSPLKPLPYDIEETRKDSEVCAQIARLLHKDITISSVVGANSLKKIVYAGVTDAYVGNSATGGLHVSRFAARPGVGHLNTRMIDASNHIRKRTRLVDKNLIIDRAEDAGNRMDFISYSIEWTVIYHDLVKVLRGDSV